MENDIQAKIRKRKTKTAVVLLVLLLIVAGLVTAYVIQQKKLDQLVFDTEKVERGTLISTVSTTGTLSPVTTVDIGSQVSGIIESINVDFNDKVKKGQILLTIDNSQYLTDLEVAQAQLRSTEADLISAKTDLEKSSIAISQAQAQVSQAQANVDRDIANLESARSRLVSAQANAGKGKAQLDNDLAEYKRAEELFNRDLISASEKEKAYTKYLVSKAGYESSIADVRTAKAQVVAAQSTVEASRSGLNAVGTAKESEVANAGSVQARISRAVAIIQQAEGRVNNVNVNIQRCTISSPIDGVVIDRKVEPGQTVAASFQAPLLLQLAENLQKMQVKASVDEADIGRVKVGQKVKFTVDAYPDDSFEGEVFQVRSTPKTQENVVTYDVIIYTDNKELKLKPGMTTNIEITSNVKRKVLLVPNSAIRFRPDRYKNFPYPDDVRKEMEEKEKMGAKNGKNAKKDTATADSTGEDGKQTGRKKGRKPKDANAKKEKEKVPIWVMEDNKPRRYMITPGITDNTSTEVTAGDLKEGMEVITDAMTGREKLKKKQEAKLTSRPGMRL
jgi:HlyD family secretion protein